MFDENNYNDMLNSISSSIATDTEQKTTTFEPQTDYDTQSQSQTYTNDDYSVTPNYTSEQSYNPTSSTVMEQNETEQRTAFSMNVPLIQKDEPTVNLIKTKQKLVFETRMKVVLSVFSVIVACLMFISIFNFVKASQIASNFDSKQMQINQLEQSISASKATYTLLSDDETVKEWAAENNFVTPSEENTIVIKLDDMYQRESVEKVQSNWFNDVCDFLSNLFA